MFYLIQRLRYSNELKKRAYFSFSYRHFTERQHWMLTTLTEFYFRWWSDSAMLLLRSIPKRNYLNNKRGGITSCRHLQIVIIHWKLIISQVLLRSYYPYCSCHFGHRSKWFVFCFDLFGLPSFQLQLLVSHVSASLHAAGPVKVGHAPSIGFNRVSSPGGRGAVLSVV